MLDRVIDAHVQRGTAYLGPVQHAPACPKGSGFAGTLESQKSLIEHITKETAVLFACVGRYEEKGQMGQVRALRFLVHAVGGA